MNDLCHYQMRWQKACGVACYNCAGGGSVLQNGPFHPVPLNGQAGVEGVGGSDVVPYFMEASIRSITVHLRALVFACQTRGGDGSLG